MHTCLPQLPKTRLYKVVVLIFEIYRSRLDLKIYLISPEKELNDRKSEIDIIFLCLKRKTGGFDRVDCHAVSFYRYSIDSIRFNHIPNCYYTPDASMIY